MALTQEQIDKMDNVSGLSASKVSEMDNASELNSSITNKPADTRTLGTKLRDIPLIGNTLSNISSVLGAKNIQNNLPMVEKATSEMQKKARELAIAARNEMDPVTKKKMLDESRRLSQTAGETASSFAKNNTNLISSFGDNKTAGNTGVKALFDTKSYQNYGPAALRSAVEVGTLISPATSGITKVATKPISQILSATVAGATTGGISGFAEGDNISTEERLKKSKESAIIGGVLSGTLASGGQLIKKGKDFIKSTSATEKGRKYLETVNPQVDVNDANYRDNYKKIVDYTKEYKFKNADDLINQISNKKTSNQKAIETIFNQSKKTVDAQTFGSNLSTALKNLEVDTRNPSVKTAIKNIGNLLDQKVTTDGVTTTIKPKDLYKLVDVFGNKAGFGKEVLSDSDQIYKLAYEMTRKELGLVSKEASKKIAEDAIIRKTLPGLIKTGKKEITTSIGKKIRNIAATASIGAGGVGGTMYIMDRLFGKKSY